ncbi:MAG: penicillin-binding protein 2 [Candidatus Doudnabacteria bacterium]|nr:penicillin-binding protein 2 [Candidatus Doudnabacteria bacterium]
MRNPFEIKTSFRKPDSLKPLDWEESAVDSNSSVDELHDAERVGPKQSWLWMVLVLTFGIFGARIFFLQIVRGSDFRTMSDNNRVRSQSLLAPRGLILDNYGQILAQNTASFNLVAIPFDLPKNAQDLETEVNTISSTFIFDKDEVLKKLRAASPAQLTPIVILQDISQDQAILFETRASEFIGFSVQQIPVRDYVEAPVFSHILGYTGLVSEDDLKHLNKDIYDSVDFTGKSGIESVYENYLHGENGRDLVEVDATGKLLNILGQNSPLPGNTLQLNIDKGLQEKLYNDLKAGNNPKAAAVAINPKTGQVLALVSLPGFDNNLFAHGIKKQDYSLLINDKNLPLFNRAIAGTYPPGSTVKPMVALAALQEGTISPNTVINDRGVLVIPNQFNPAISYNFYGWDRGGLGPMNVYSAIAESSDIYFYTVAGGHPSSQVKGLGAEKLAEYYKKFNLGSPVGIDLPGEKPGVVADPTWKANYFKNDPILSKWYLGDTYHIGIGQGDMLVTPLQVAEWTATIANGGTGMKPQLLNKVMDTNGKTIFQNQPQVLVQKFVDDANIKAVQQGMRETVISGSGHQLASLPITSAGKTGTSQFDGADPKRTHAWFTAYAPYEDPQIVITVLVEAGGEGHIASVPVVKDALLWWAQNRYGK